MSNNEQNDFQYINFDNEQAKRMVIEHTTDKWKTAKSIGAKVLMLLFLSGIVYVFWSIWQWYFWIDYFLALLPMFFVARAIVRVKQRWFIQLDVTGPRFNIWGIPKSWSWSGQALPCTDNNDNQISLVRTIDIKPSTRTVKTSMSLGDYDRLQFVNDARVLDKVVEKLEHVNAQMHYLKQTFYNEILTYLGTVQTEAIIKPINELLRKPSIDTERTTSGLKRGETGSGTVTASEDYGDED